ncbi:zinc finger, CCHC-type containing protein [Tanacetum coccineum]|uniref:Zinc finger, CCHC-type containing protein n=1 Tax=Tanacetum coccineum TaxID=301880 RepID=A0ABQ5H4E5_9ASTR
MHLCRIWGERGIECIFVGYAEHSKAFRFYIIEPNESVLINSIIESMDAIFDENRFYSVPRLSLRIPNRTEDIGGSVVPEEVVTQQPEPETRKCKRNRTPKNFGPEYQLYLIEGTKDEVSNQHSYCFNVEDDPKTFDKAIKSKDVAFWKEAINDEMDSILGNNTWVLADLPPGLQTKVRIDNFDTYDPVARINTIRLLIALASIHSLIIHQMDMKTTFLNGELDDEVYMNQPQGFIMPGNENKVCKLIKSLYGLNKFDESGKGVIISLYVDDMLIFGTKKVLVDLTNEFLSSRFSMKDMGEADIIHGIRIKHESNRIAISQSYYIEKVLKKFNYFDCTLGDWLFDVCHDLTRPDIAFTVAPISIRCDSAATLAKAYSQMYNGKSRHLGVRHNTIHELIMNEVVSIEFVRSQQNLADHLTKRLARDLVLKSAEGMGLKSNLVDEC